MYEGRSVSFDTWPAISPIMLEFGSNFGGIYLYIYYIDTHKIIKIRTIAQSLGLSM